MKFNQESFKDAFKDAQELTRDHHSEVTIFDGLPLEIDAAKYQFAEDQGILKVFTIREEEKLIGYASFFLYTHSHHLSSVHATQDTIYITPSRRGVGLEFSQYCDEQLKNCGVSHVHRALPIGSSFGEKLARNGYEAKETVYIRRLA